MLTLLLLHMPSQEEALKRELEFSGASVHNFSCTQPALAEEQSLAWENSKVCWNGLFLRGVVDLTSLSSVLDWQLVLQQGYISAG